MSLIEWIKRGLSNKNFASSHASSNSLGESAQADQYFSVATERDLIRSLLTTPDPDLVIVDAKWFHQLQSYLEGGPKPEKMSEKSLLTKHKKLKKGLKVTQDFYFIYKKVWEKLKSSENETITSAINKKILRLPCSELAESHKNIMLAKDLETDRFDPTDLQLPLTIPRNEYQENPYLLDEEDLKRDTDSTNQSTLSPLESEGSCLSVTMRLLRGRVGLENPGLLCYLNAGIQCMLSISKLSDIMLKQFYLGKVEDKVFCKLIVKLIQSIFSLKSGIVKPIPLWKFVAKTFPDNKQHDMPEFFRFIINQIDSELGEGNLIKKEIFNGVLCSNLVCTKCLNSSKKYEPFIDLQIELSESIEKSIILFTQDEVLNTGYFCANCKAKSPALKSLSIHKPPNYLVLQVKRFRQSPYPHKLTSFTKYRKRMTIGNGASSFHYELVALGVHIGSINTGHYIAYGKRNKNWYCFDDSLCSRVPIKSVLSQYAYMLVYRMI